ncbi:hypothetical protein ZWY2020_020041 [Hordeum vulgare]|nr:hypothetical protein ZWY2020_020041 [Hordeum vulgare]
MSKFATPPPARNLDMSPVLDTALPDDARDAMPDTARDTMPDTARDAMPDTAMPNTALPNDAMLDTARDTTLPDVPLGVFLDAHIARVTANARDASETTDTIEIEPTFAPARSSSPRYELPDIAEDINVNDLKLLSKHASMITTQVEQVLKAQNDLLNELNDNSVTVITRGGKMTQEPLYPEGHPKRIDQDSQGINADTPNHPKEKMKDDRNLHASSPNTVTPEEPNDISASDAETQSGDEHEPGDNMDNDVHNNAQPCNDEDVEIEPTMATFIPVKFTEFCQLDATMPFRKELMQITKDLRIALPTITWKPTSSYPEDSRYRIEVHVPGRTFEPRTEPVDFKFIAPNWILGRDMAVHCALGRIKEVYRGCPISPDLFTVSRRGEDGEIISSKTKDALLSYAQTLEKHSGTLEHRVIKDARKIKQLSLRELELEEAAREAHYEHELEVKDFLERIEKLKTRVAYLEEELDMGENLHPEGDVAPLISNEEDYEESSTKGPTTMLF